MTTIIYHNGLMLGDTRAYGFDRAPIGVKAKVYRLDNGSLFGCSAAGIGIPGLVLAWLEAGRPGDMMPNLEGWSVEAMLVAPNGMAEIFDKNLRPSIVTAKFYVVGSGRDYAYAAMHLGLSSAQAVALACDLDPWTDFPLYGLTHDGETVAYRTRRGLKVKLGG